MVFEMLETLEECLLCIDLKKVIFPKNIKFSISKASLDYEVNLGDRCIFKSKNEEDAREYYEVLRFEIERGKYKLIISSSLYPKIDTTD